MKNAVESRIAGRRIQPVQRRGIDKVETILSCARSTLSEPNGELTIRGLSKDAGMSVGTIYRYFDSLEAVIDAALNEHAERAEADVASLLAETDASNLNELFETLFEHFVDFYGNNPKFTRARFAGRHAERYGAIEDASNQRLARLLARTAVDTGFIPDHPDVAVRVLVHWSAIGAVLRVAFSTNPSSIDVALAEARDMITHFAGSYQ